MTSWIPFGHGCVFLGTHHILSGWWSRLKPEGGRQGHSFNSMWKYCCSLWGTENVPDAGCRLQEEDFPRPPLLKQLWVNSCAKRLEEDCATSLRDVWFSHSPQVFFGSVSFVHQWVLHVFRLLAGSRRAHTFTHRLCAFPHFNKHFHSKSAY